jgi:hypothetical protein
LALLLFVDWLQEAMEGVPTVLCNSVYVLIFDVKQREAGASLDAQATNTPIYIVGNHVVPGSG